MPNSCENRLIIKGDPSEIRKIKEVVYRISEDGSEEIRFCDLIPKPEILEGTSFPPLDDEIHQEAMRQTGHSNWLTWTTQNWGTKWGDYEHFAWMDDEDRIDSGFITAWGPFSDSFWAEVSDRFPDAVFMIQYHEPSEEFFGIAVYHNGEVITHDEFSGDDYPSYPEDDEDETYLDHLEQTMDQHCQEAVEMFFECVLLIEGKKDQG